jgi:rhodanese-related sulfurtransferase
MFSLKRKGKNDIDALEAYELIASGSSKEFVILDVRSPEEYSDSHIASALNINYNSRKFQNEVEKLEKNNKYLVYCRSGHRSSNAVKVMKNLGFTDLYNLSGGIQKWNRKSLPLVK